MSIAALNYVAALIAGEGVKTYLKHGKVGHLFMSDADKALFTFLDHHVQTYGKLPDPETVLSHGKVDLPTSPPEPPEYYLDLLRRAYVEVSIRSAAKQADTLLKGDDKDPMGALAALRSGISTIDAEQMASTVTDYRESAGLLWGDYLTTLKGAGESNLKFGWSTLDEMAGGICEGDVVSLVGSSGLGKTWIALWIALNIWQQGRPVMFVSMEIKPLRILQRLSAIHAHKPIKGITQGALTTYAKEGWADVLNGLAGLPHPFWVVDGNLQATAKDISALGRQLKPGAIIIDGAYLMKNHSERDRYRRVAENMDLIKTDIAAVAPTICTWQFSREAKKVKKGEQPGLEHIGYSDAIGTHSSLVLGLFENDTVETGISRRLCVLKGRQGESGEFYVRWCFDNTTDFSEIEPENVEDLSF